MGCHVHGCAHCPRCTRSLWINVFNAQGGPKVDGANITVRADLGRAAVVTVVRSTIADLVKMAGDRLADGRYLAVYRYCTGQEEQQSMAFKVETPPAPQQTITF